MPGPEAFSARLLVRPGLNRNRHYQALKKGSMQSHELVPTAPQQQLQSAQIVYQYDVGMLARELTNAKAALLIAQGMKVTSQQQAEAAQQFCTVILATVDRLEEARTSITKKILAGKYAVDDLFSPVTGPLKTAADTIKATVGEYVVAGKREQQRQFEEAAAAHRQGNSEAMVQALQQSSLAAVVQAPQGMSVREVWVAEVFNPTLLVQACLVDPSYHQYLAPNMATIDAVAASTPDTDEPIAIPGVRFTKRAHVSASHRPR